jgi:ankyrin repeat protein
VDSRDKYGSIPLTAAAANGHIGIVAKLLNRGAAVDFRGKFAGISLNVAAERDIYKLSKKC